MSWIYTDKQTPIAFEEGEWDGKKSEQVIASDILGKLHLATFYEGFLDGSEFKDWYDNNDFPVEGIVRWLPIPD